MLASLRFAIIQLMDVVLRRSTTCCGCGALHHTRNRCNSTFSAFCSEDCFAANMPPQGYPLAE